MDAAGFFAGLVADQKEGRPRGICSVCSAHATVLEAACAQAMLDGLPVLIESTVNQVNQLGGYTGITPRDFRAFVEAAAARVGLPRERILLGGDHLGPYPWRSQPAAAAMARARTLVESCVEAGYRKLHLDASMPLGGDAVDANGALEPALAAEREAELAAAAEAACARAGSTGQAAPVYVIGTEVPVPGGASAGGQGVAVTRPGDLEETVTLCREAFRARGLAAAWDRVRAVVAQPGVEFSDRSVHAYDRPAAAELCAAVRRLPGLVLEGHSTDYQLPAHLRQLVEDGVSILKVGPALTFALRECLFQLEAIEQELLAMDPDRPPSRLAETLERAMLADPRHWKPYYAGSPGEQRFARRFSLSDRSRYYWSVPEVAKARDQLMANLAARPLPLPLLSQHLPLLYRAVREGKTSPRPGDLSREAVRLVLKDYSAAVRGAGE